MNSQYFLVLLFLHFFNSPFCTFFFKDMLLKYMGFQHLMLEELYYLLISFTTPPASDEIRLWQNCYQKNDLLLSLRHMIQVRVINKIASVSHDRGTYPANLVTATTTMEVIQEDQLIPPGQVPLRPPSKDTQAVTLFHIVHCTLQKVLGFCNVSPVSQTSSV